MGKKYYYSFFEITYYFSSDVRFTNIVVQSTGQSGVETKYRVPAVRGQWGMYADVLLVSASSCFVQFCIVLCRVILQ